MRDDHIFNAESIIAAMQGMPVVKKRPGPVDALVVVCALDFNLTSFTLVSSDADLNALAGRFGVTTVNPETP